MSHVTVTVDTLRGPGTTNAQLTSNLTQVSRIVWQELPGHFDLLTMVVPGIGSRTITHAQLAEKFGPRPAGLESAPLAGQTHTSRTFLVLRWLDWSSLPPLSFFWSAGAKGGSNVVRRCNAKRP